VLVITDGTVRQAWDVLHDVVEPAVFGPAHPLTITAHHVPGEPISPADALVRPYGAFAVGDAWGPCWGTTWFHLEGRVPGEWAGQEVVLRLESLRMGTAIPGGEFLIFAPRPEAGGRLVPLLGLSEQHAAASLVDSAAGGEAVDLHVEAAANPTTPEDRM
jgi:alpha-mannosidase